MNKICKALRDIDVPMVYLSLATIQRPLLPPFRDESFVRAKKAKLEGFNRAIADAPREATKGLPKIRLRFLEKKQ
jgi:hypothetical protein